MQFSVTRVVTNLTLMQKEFWGQKYMLWNRKPDPVDVASMDPHGMAILEHVSSGKEQTFNCRTLGSKIVRMSLSSSMYVSPSRVQREVVDKAVSLCRGRVLDVGAGGGFASLKLQSAGYDVTALDVSEYCIEAMKISGIKCCELGEITTYNERKFDTFLFLDSTIGCQGTLENIERMLVNLHNISTPTAQIIVHDGIVEPGVISYEWEAYFQYKQFVGKPFRWCSLSLRRLEEIATRAGWHLSVPSEQHFEWRYLCVLERNG